MLLKSTGLCTFQSKFFFLFLWQIRPSCLFPFRIYMKLWILETVGRTLWTGPWPVAILLPTRDNTHTGKSADIHPCHKWDSNPSSQCSNRWRNFTPHMAWPVEPPSMKIKGPKTIQVTKILSYTNSSYLITLGNQTMTQMFWYLY
jgi:hypothetical protein